MSFELDRAIAEFVECHTAHHDKRVDNSQLIAGSPMHYYCRYCSKPTETLEEEHTKIPLTVCAGCDALKVHGALDAAIRALEESKAAKHLEPGTQTE